MSDNRMFQKHLLTTLVRNTKYLDNTTYLPSQFLYTCIINTLGGHLWAALETFLYQNILSLLSKTFSEEVLSFAKSCGF